MNKAKNKIISVMLVAVLMLQCAFSQYTVLADSDVYVEITGYQISYSLKGYRTLYTIVDSDDKVEEVGLVYGLTDRVTDEDMVVGSTNETVYSFVGTSQGIASVKYTSYDDATTYITTMEFIKKVEFYNTSISIRAYAKLKDGSYVYSNISTMSVYRVASTLYDKCLMATAEGHAYLYSDILTLIDPEYTFVDYNWGSAIVSPKTTKTLKTQQSSENEQVVTTATDEAATDVIEETTVVSAVSEETTALEETTILEETAEETTTQNEIVTEEIN